MPRILSLSGRELLLSACQLHEIGLSVDFKQAPYHAAYLVRHLICPLYARAEKVARHPYRIRPIRRSLRFISKTRYVPPRVANSWRRLLCPAILFAAGRRRDDLVPEITLQALNENLTLTSYLARLAGASPAGQELIDQKASGKAWAYYRPLDVR